MIFQTDSCGFCHLTIESECEFLFYAPPAIPASWWKTIRRRSYHRRTWTWRLIKRRRSLLSVHLINGSCLAGHGLIPLLVQSSLKCFWYEAQVTVLVSVSLVELERNFSKVIQASSSPRYTNEVLKTPNHKHSFKSNSRGRNHILSFLTNLFWQNTFRLSFINSHYKISNLFKIILDFWYSFID